MTDSASPNRNWGKILIGIGITVALLWWVLSSVPIGEVVETIRNANAPLLAASALVVVTGYLIRALRWKILLAGVKPDTTLRSRFAAISIHFMTNNILPLRVGEFARAWVISRLESVSASAAFGSVVVERFMDAVILLLFLVVPTLLPSFPASGALSEGWGGILLKAGTMAVVVILSALIAAVAFPNRFIGIVKWASPLFPESFRAPLLDSLESFLSSLTILRDPKLVLLGFAWSFTFWAWNVLSFWLGMLAFGIDTGIASAVFTMAVVGFGVALPSAPGFLGTFQAAALFALRDVYGIDAAPSLAFAFGYFFTSWLPITVIGLAYLWRLGFSLSELGSAEEQVS